MKRLIWAVACFALMGGSSRAAGTAPVSGIDVQYVDDGVRAQDDLYRHVNGKWLASFEIPADKPIYNMFSLVDDKTQEQLRTIVEGLQKSVDPADPDQRKIADLYASFMDEDVIEKLGTKPLDTDYARIAALKSKADIPALIAHLQRIGVATPYTPQVHQDAKDSTKYVFDIGQSGLGMPDRDYYLQGQAQMKSARIAYAAHIKRMLTLAGDPTPAGNARDIVALETALAKIQWTKVELRDPVKVYNKYKVAELAKLAPGYDWNAYLAAAGVAGRTDYLVVGQPTYIAAFNRLLKATPLPVWQAYFRWQALSATAPYLGRAFVDESFAFNGKTLQGSEKNRDRWKRGVALVDGAIGESLGKLYVAAYFPAAAKAQMEKLVQNLLATYQADIRTVDWMGPETRRHAQEKLGKFTTKIGYPSKWRDYSALTIVKGDLVGNLLRSSEFEYERNLRKLGQPIDRSEWGMTPQTVNAYYNPEKNEIVFPAAILQPPFFNMQADDAVNYGGIGSVIGHEISHGFDDQGSQYDGDGNLLVPPGWFTKADLERYTGKARALVKQYAAYSPVPGYPVNGELTLGENIADNSGLAIAYKAYQLSLSGKEAPVIDGLTGAQRFFYGFARAWRGKARDSYTILLIKTDPHSPDAIRGELPEMNMDAFYDAFGVKSGDKMYRSPVDRVSIW